MCCFFTCSFSELLVWKVHQNLPEHLESTQSVFGNQWYTQTRWHTLFSVYIYNWSLLKSGLNHCCPGEVKIPAEFCEKDLDYNSTFRVLLPQRHGPGLCSTALVSYLIALHNGLVNCVDEYSPATQTRETRWGRSCLIFPSLVHFLLWEYTKNTTLKYFYFLMQ